MIALQCHPASSSAAARRVSAEAVLAGGMLRLRYLIEGNPEALRLPPRGLRPLWQHTCCEAFVGAPTAAAYREYNFSPSGEWAAYAFVRYRDGGPVEAPDPGIAVQILDDGFQLTAATPAPEVPLRLALTAVVEARDGTLSYWALRHPPGKPDFHHPDGFVLRLP